jgi:hypothetical protein
MPKGMWSHHTRNGNTVNALCPDHTADLGGQATYNDARVQVARTGSPRPRDRSPQAA